MTQEAPRAVIMFDGLPRASSLNRKMTSRKKLQLYSRDPAAADRPTGCLALPWEPVGKQVSKQNEQSKQSKASKQASKQIDHQTQIGVKYLKNTPVRHNTRNVRPPNAKRQASRSQCPAGPHALWVNFKVRCPRRCPSAEWAARLPSDG